MRQRDGRRGVRRHDRRDRLRHLPHAGVLRAAARADRQPRRSSSTARARTARPSPGPRIEQDEQHEHDDAYVARAGRRDPARGLRRRAAHRHLDAAGHAGGLQGARPRAGPRPRPPRRSRAANGGRRSPTRCWTTSSSAPTAPTPAIQVAAARLAQARALVRIGRCRPHAAGRHRRPRPCAATASRSPVFRPAARARSMRAAANASYELDLFGAPRAGEPMPRSSTRTPREALLQQHASCSRRPTSRRPTWGCAHSTTSASLVRRTVAAYRDTLDSPSAATAPATSPSWTSSRARTEVAATESRGARARPPARDPGARARGAGRRAGFHFL